MEGKRRDGKDMQNSLVVDSSCLGALSAKKKGWLLGFPFGLGLVLSLTSLKANAKRKSCYESHFFVFNESQCQKENMLWTLSGGCEKNILIKNLIKK